MYLPSPFHETRLEVLHALMRTHPLATLITGSTPGFDPFDADHLPVSLITQPAANAAADDLGVLRAHVARANPLWQKIAQAPAGVMDVLAIFHGPEAYVTPSWYPSKADTGKVVPTWNYAVVHAHGQARVIDDPAWVRAQMHGLTHHQEQARPAPWQMLDAPSDYIERMVSAVVGIEITITRLTGKFKLSQNQTAPNRAGVIQGLDAQTAPAQDANEALTKLMRNAG
jgi:transcriptional regulator